MFIPSNKGDIYVSYLLPHVNKTRLLFYLNLSVMLLDCSLCRYNISPPYPTESVCKILLASGHFDALTDIFYPSLVDAYTSQFWETSAALYISSKTTCGGIDVTLAYRVFVRLVEDSHRSTNWKDSRELHWMMLFLLPGSLEIRGWLQLLAHWSNRHCRGFWHEWIMWCLRWKLASFMTDSFGPCWHQSWAIKLGGQSSLALDNRA